MGSPLSPIVSNLVLEDVEKRALSSLDFVPLIYKRYVDDILVIIPSDKILDLVNAFNSIGHSIQFTYKTERNNALNYLDLNIIKTTDDKLITNWYKKPSWSGRYLNYDSHHLFGQKIGLIKGLVDRCIKLSDIQFRKENLDNIKVTLLINSYPRPFVESCTYDEALAARLNILIKKKGQFRSNFYSGVKLAILFYV